MMALNNWPLIKQIQQHNQSQQQQYPPTVILKNPRSRWLWITSQQLLHIRCSKVPVSNLSDPNRHLRILTKVLVKLPTFSRRQDRHPHKVSNLRQLICCQSSPRPRKTSLQLVERPPQRRSTKTFTQTADKTQAWQRGLKLVILRSEPQLRL